MMTLLELLIFAALVTFCVLRALIWVWWEPMKLERQLRRQGIKGPPYKLFHGSLKDNSAALMEAQSKPMKLSHSILPRVLPFIHQTVQNYGKLCIFWQGVTPRVIVADPELIKEILLNKSGDFYKIRPNPFVLLLITGVTTYDGEKWAKHRKIINPAFHLEKLKIMFPAFRICCEELISRWENLVLDGPLEIDVSPEFQKLTGDVISRTTFGSNYEEGRRIFQLQTEQARLVSQVIQSAYIPGYRLLATKSNNRMKEIERESKALFEEMIKKREKDLKQGECQNDDLLSLLIDSNFKEVLEHGDSESVGLTIDEIIAECKLFYFAGQETTYSLLVWAMVLLGMHQEWQERAREEVLQVFGRSTEPDFDGLSKLKIVTIIIYEVLRLYPPFVMLTRLTHEKVKVGEVTLPQGVEIGLPILLVHHDRDIWGEDVHEFRPERFAEGVSKAMQNRISFFPFSWGPRICIGQNFALVEAKMALVMILQHFSFKLSTTYVHAPYTVVTLQPQYGAQIILVKL
ncbi:hypothetical protein Syun_027438 [Stephania yunnanensis]|uniref:Cytochrome P450 n=1 Tax=Stephania yunnanensis TaxID=152371 RepID=A0AAP0EIY7_9MAGN